MLIPIAQITWRISTLNKGLKVHPKVMMIISTNTSQIPRLSKNKLTSFKGFFE